eukprot:9293855-Pyramimonas_sp.AAC.1
MSMLAAMPGFEGSAMTAHSGPPPDPLNHPLRTPSVAVDAMEEASADMLSTLAAAQLREPSF